MSRAGDKVEEILRTLEEKKAKRASLYPDEARCLEVMSDVYERLTDLGWRNAIYCPKDGTVFHAIEAGSTGIHECSYIGRWPTGVWLIHGDDDLWPARPILFKPKSAGVALDKEGA